MRSLLLLTLPLTLVSCVLIDDPNPSYQVDAKKYRQLESKDARIEISLWDQKAWLLNEKDEAVLVTDVATGIPGKETPQGEFTVLERIESKRSNLYGKYVEKETRKVVVEQSWQHEGLPPEGTEFEGIAMPFWMRLTWVGVGMHVGQFKKRTRNSFGCVRVYEEAQSKIFEKTQLGTPVKIASQSLSDVNRLN